MDCKKGGGCSFEYVEDREVSTKRFSGMVEIYKCKRCGEDAIKHPIRGMVREK